MNEQKIRSARVHFETADNWLAAFLTVRGVEYFGLGFDPDREDDIVTHTFDDEQAKMSYAVLAYRSGEHDEVKAVEFLQTYERLKAIREDEELRQRRETAFRKITAQKECE